MSDDGAVAALTHAILSNPSWPAVPGEGKWAALPAELQPVFAQLDRTLWDASIAWWLDLVVMGAVGFDLIMSLPSDVHYVFWPEICRVLDLTPASQGVDNLSGGNQTGTLRYESRRGTKRHYKMPHPIILCHLFARLMVLPYYGAVVNYHRVPKSCLHALQGMLAMLALATLNGQVLLTFRTMAISKSVPGHIFAWIFLWACNVVTAVVWLYFAFVTTADNLPTNKPLGFRFGYNCSPPVSKRYLPMIFYSVTLVQDTVMFILPLLAIHDTISNPGPNHQRGRLSWLTTFKNLLKYAFWCMLGTVPKIDGMQTSSMVAATFIADGGRYLLLYSWVLEAVGIGFAIGFVLTRSTPNQLSMAWMLPFHALNLALIPKTVVSLKRVAYFERNAAGSDPSRGKWGAQELTKSGIMIRSKVERHVEDDIEAVPGDIGLRDLNGHPVFASYRPTLVLEDVRTFGPEYKRDHPFVDKESSGIVGINQPSKKESFEMERSSSIVSGVHRQPQSASSSRSGHHEDPLSPSE